MNWYPIKLSVHIRTYAFGERLIPEMLGKTGMPDGVVAEVWEYTDHADTSAIVLNGELAGTSIRDLTLTYPEEFVGTGWRGPHFPLLGKFLDASHMLPVHLHADDETAARIYSAPNGKTEAWHILWAAPGASILAGTKPDKTREQLVAAFKMQDYDAVMPRYPISSGDTVYVPGCILHSFGPDTLIFEIQQTSDLGRMVMPTDLFGNELSPEQWDADIESALAELKTDFLPQPNAGLAIMRGHNRYSVGAAGKYFALERWTLSSSHTEPAHPQRCLAVTNLGDPVQIHFPGGVETLAKAESCIMPAPIGEVTIATTRKGDLIVCYVPDLERDIIEPLLAAGHSHMQINALGLASGR